MCRPQIRVNAKLGALSAAVLIASLVFIGLAPGQTSNLRAFGRVEGAAPTMTIGVAVSGIVRNLLVHEGDRVHKAQTLVQLDCRQIEADVQVREARLAAAQATFDRYRNGSRPDEISVGEAAVRYAQARADEAEKALGRAEAMQEGVTVTTARVLEVRRDARIAAAQLEEAQAKLSLLRAGSREEEIRHAEALRNAAIADLDTGRARLDRCTIRAPGARRSHQSRSVLEFCRSAAALAHRPRRPIARSRRGQPPRPRAGLHVANRRSYCRWIPQRTCPRRRDVDQPYG
jgi:multidrug resistance efflux pump